MGALLALLARKGETWEEVFAFARAMRERVDRPTGMPEGPLLDIVGTGGDGHDTLNLSTTAAIVVAACGVRVAKHGSVSVSSRSGSADVLARLGVRQLGPSQVGACLERCGITFMFAPLFHPAMRHVVPVRKALRIRTIFNILGPLLNPAGARRLVLGVYSPRLLDVYGRAVAALGADHALIVHCCGLDELAPLGVAQAVEVRGEHITPLELDTVALSGGGSPCTIADLRGADPEHNAAAIRHILSDPSMADTPVGRTVALNAGAALYVAGRADTLDEGVRLARLQLLAGTSIRTLEEWSAATAE